jgi:hypothetical protein
MKQGAFILLLSLAGILLTACGGPSPTQPGNISAVVPTDQFVPDSATPLAEPTTQAEATAVQIDEQGAVKVSVTPINLQTARDALEFEIVLDTHSIDLSMDLATLATLTNDTGRTVTPIRWDGPPGGHHVAGVLSFPAEMDGVPLLDSASRLTLTLRDIDAPERVFSWEVSPAN